MTVKSGQQWSGLVPTLDGEGYLLAATVGPVGALVSLERKQTDASY